MAQLISIAIIYHYLWPSTHVQAPVTPFEVNIPVLPPTPATSHWPHPVAQQYTQEPKTKQHMPRLHATALCLSLLCPATCLKSQSNHSIPFDSDACLREDKATPMKQTIVQSHYKHICPWSHTLVTNIDPSEPLNVVIGKCREASPPV